MKRWVYCFALALGLAFALAACGGSSDSSSGAGSSATTSESEQGEPTEKGQSGEMSAVNVGTAPVTNLAAYQLGVDKGFFTEEGLEIHNQEVPSGASSIALLLNGQLDFAFGAPDGPIAAVAEGVPVKMVGSFAADRESPQGPQYGTVVPAGSSIKSWQDLAGKTVGINSVQSGWEFWNREAVNKEGGDGASVKFVQIPFANQLPALDRGQVDALSTGQPFLSQAIAGGAVSLGNPTAIAFGEPEANPSVTIVAAKLAETEPEIVERFQRAMQRSADYANEHPDEIYAVAAKMTGAPLDALEAIPLPLYTAAVNRPTLEKETQFMKKFGVIEEAPPYDELVFESPSE